MEETKTKASVIRGTSLFFMDHKVGAHLHIQTHLAIDLITLITLRVHIQHGIPDR